MRRVLVLFTGALLALAVVVPAASAHNGLDPNQPVSIDTIKHLIAEDRGKAAPDNGPTEATKCEDGQAGEYPCENVDLLSHMPLEEFGSESGNDIWGWTDPETGKEYALMGLNDGTGFVDVSEPTNPVYLGKLPTRTEDSIWRDVKVYKDHAFIVSEAEGHGMQVFDLTRLREASGPQEWTADANYAEFSNAHNVAINEETGFAYAIGTNTCEGGPHMVNIKNPTDPTFAGCVSGDGYTHDTQVVVYEGPDEDYQGREIAFSANEDTLTIVDVTRKSAPEQIARINYAGSVYTHQGWLTEDQGTFLLGDELDEFATQGVVNNTTTYIFDLEDLDDPTVATKTQKHVAETDAIDHNLYTTGDFVHQANYRAGYRLLDGSAADDGELTEVGFFDIYPEDDASEFNGAWSNSPYFDNGTVIVSGIEQGLFVLEPTVEGFGPPEAEEPAPGEKPGKPGKGKGPGGPPGRR